MREIQDSKILFTNVHLSSSTDFSFKTQTSNYKYVNFNKLFR